MKVQDKSLNLGQVLLNQTNTDEGRFCDVILQVENKDFHAHRSVLASRCEYFNTMFSVNMKEKHDKVITMQGFTANVFNEVLNWIYIGEATITADNVINLYRACSMMQINQLLDHVKKFLVENIEELLLNNQDFDLTFDEMKEVLESNQINDLNQQKIFECILKWINQNVEERKMKFPDLFQLVCLDLLSSDYLYNVISKNEVFKQFSDSRDRIEEALYKHENDKMKSSTSFSPSQNSSPDLLVAVPFLNTYFDVIEIESKKLTRYHKCLANHLQYNLKDSCCIALSYPRIVLCKNSSPDISSKNKVIMFNGSEWHEMPSLSKSLNGCAAIFFDENLYVFGGERSVNDSRKYIISRVGKMLTDEFDCNKKPRIEEQETEKERKKYWKDVYFGFKPSSYLSAQTVDNKIYLIGGFTYKRGCDRLAGFELSDENKVACADTTIYCPLTKTSIKGIEMKKARAAFACATLDSTIYVCGGIGIGGRNLSCVEYLDTTTNVWTSVTPKNLRVSGKMFHGCFIDERLYFATSSKVFVYDTNSNLISLVSESGLLLDLSRNGVLIFPFSQTRLQQFMI